MARLILIRHGAVDEAWKDRIYGRVDVALSKVGEEEARSVARSLASTPLDAVYYSGLSRAGFTADLLAQARDLEPKIDPDFLEMDRGSWARRTRADIADSEPELWSKSQALGGALNPPDGEPLDSIFERVARGLDRVAAAHPDGQVAIVAHLWVLRASVAMTDGLAREQLAQTAVPTAGRVTIEWPEGKRLTPVLPPDES